MIERLEVFLRGEPDGPLEEALAARSGNALMTAFELLARARSVG